MHSLVKYADPSVARGATDAIMKTLTDRQNRDGGWSWCPDMESSEFITSEVVRVLGNLQSMGYLPKGANRSPVRDASMSTENLPRHGTGQDAKMSRS